MDWPICRHVERQAVRMREMMEKLNVDEGKLVRLEQGAAYAEARTRCMYCPVANECLFWIDADPPSAIEPDFCPNFRLFSACTRT